MNHSLSSQVHRRTSKFGFWIECLSSLHHHELVVTKNVKSNQIFFRLEIIRGILISIPITKSLKTLKIQNPQRKSTIFLKFPTKQDTSVWFTALIERSKSNFFFPTPIAVIGSGFFSTVELLKLHDELIAQKAVSKSLIKQHKLEKNVYFERDCMIECAHPFIVQLRYCYQTSSTFYYGMNFLRGGDLYSLMQRHQISLFDIKLYLYEIGIALSHIHSKGFVYRDLKPENVLIGEDGHIQLADFGFSKNIVKEGYTTSFCGTYCFIAPEMIEGLRYDYSVD
jgi:hypothetical protein